MRFIGKFYQISQVINQHIQCMITHTHGGPHNQRLSPFKGVRTLRTLDISDPRQFGTSAEVSVGHFGPFQKCWDTSAPSRHHAQHMRCKNRF